MVISNRAAPENLRIPTDQEPTVVALGNDQDFRTWIENALAPEKPVFCTNLESLIRIIREHVIEMVIFLDAVELPSLEMIAEIDEHMPTVVVQAHLDPQSAARFIAAGVAGYLSLECDTPSVREALVTLRLRHEARRNREKAYQKLSSRQRVLQTWIRNASREFEVFLHETRTPVAIVLGYCANLIDGVISPPIAGEHKETLERIHDAAKLLTELLARAPRNFPTPMNSSSEHHEGRLPARRQIYAAEVCEHAAALLRAHARALDISLIIEAKPCPAIWGERTRLVQLIINLVSNACRYTHPGGEIKVCVRERREPELAAALSAPCEIVITDTGEGIDEEHLKNIFVEGWTNAAGEGHSGMGLTICRQIADEHGADLSVTSKKGQGTTFTLVIPPDLRAQPTRISLMHVEDIDLAAHLVTTLSLHRGGRIKLQRPRDPESVVEEMARVGGTLLFLGPLDEQVRTVIKHCTI